ncbi:MAG TPA: prepilin-type N-terminal cleavage/methylation domain-containing protein [Gemmataceae bacterium]|nr:prepilin-type N-terminal cleavage/methylation domain-containing protein [Gemmataceae bacterium]
MSPRRSGFTLVEMLVALGIILILASLTVAFLPALNDRQRATQGASQVQNALDTARHRALRDGSPRGVRLVVDATTASGGSAATTLQFIEQPEDFTGGNAAVTAVNSATTPPTATVQLTGAPDLFGGFGPGSSAYWAVQPGDYFVLGGTNAFLIVGGPTSSTAGGTTGDTFTINAQGSATMATVSSPTPAYAILRAPRVMTGDDPMQLPDKVGVDLAANRSVLSADSHGGQAYYDILFDPSGRLLRQGLINGKVILWIRDITDANMGGDQTLLTVYARSGLVVPAQADPGPNNDFNNSVAPTGALPVYSYSDGSTPYTYALQGQGSGM